MKEKSNLDAKDSLKSIWTLFEESKNLIEHIDNAK